jgi:E3 ubiquitin-protein ligase TRIP12
VALIVFDLFDSSSSILDVHFQGEVGTGLGPTLEFFASVCREFAWRDLKLWRDADSTLSGRYVHHPLGLFPAPMLNRDQGLLSVTSSCLMITPMPSANDV